jgi:hypothetical protein
VTEEKKRIDNPAGRLKEILERARTINGGNVRTGLAQTFEIADQEDFGEIYMSLAAFNETAKDVATQLKGIQNQEFYLIYTADLRRIKRFAQAMGPSTEEECLNV